MENKLPGNIQKYCVIGIVLITSLILITHMAPEALLTLTGTPLSERFQIFPRQVDDSMKVLSDTSGSIGKLVMNIPREERDQIVPVLRDFLEQLDPRIDLTFSCSDEYSVSALMHCLQTGREHVPWNTEVVVTGFDLTPWARDRRIARSGLQGSERSSLVPPAKDWYDINRRNEIKLPFILEDLKIAPEATPLPFILDGGNLVNDADYAFIGGNNIALNRNLIPKAQDFKRMLALYLGKKVIHVFARKQQVPWEHIDMYVTPLAGKKIMVGSPALAQEIFAQVSENHPIVSEKFLKTSFSKERTQLFDDVAIQLGKLGCEVIRVPVVPHYTDHWMITYNNVLMDFRDHRSVVYLPVFGIKSLDRFAENVYLDAGFEVRKVNLYTLYRHGGTLRCFANVTKRIPNSGSIPTTALNDETEINIHRPQPWKLQRVMSNFYQPGDEDAGESVRSINQ